ncbi:hypothetical protein HLB23_22580 [Nocardia uniformis]|uniref:Uncharacterized protein n=1 Tax=Nocardia uniformis TaxID=53432 RepID=A0A849C1J3_9NOCA|nr:hypothetical protein [Nocardia uniformis]NNH72613.1 hypothetical protein [Nocardia uniformis]
MDERQPRYAIAECVVTGYAPWGILVTTDAGRHGWVAAEYLADGTIRRDEWPAVGTRLTGVVLGYTHAGRIRLATIPSYVAALRDSTDPAAAARLWAAERRH